MKRIVSQYHYYFLEKEFKGLEDEGKLGVGQADDLLNHYEIQKVVIAEKKVINPMHVLLVIGAVLIGLSFLSFVASNWSELTDMTKYVFLLILFIGFYVAGFKCEKKNKYLSKVFYYIGGFAYGAEVIYIGQLFHLGGAIQTDLFLWGIGVLPLGFYLKDEILKLLGLFFIYLSIHIQFIFVENSSSYMMLVILPLMFAFGHRFMKGSVVVLIANLFVLYEFIQIQLLVRPIMMDRYPFEMILVLAVLFYIGHKIMNKSLVLFVINLLIGLELIGLAIMYYGGSYVQISGFLLFFVIGMILTYLHHENYKEPMKIVGIALQVVAGIALTFPSVWLELLNGLGYLAAIAFSVIYVAYQLYYVKQGKLLNIAVICVLIFRFYVDLSLAFLDKSVMFFVGGLLLIALGYWVEQTRKKGAGSNEKK